jgi:hypothetical protein
VNAKLWVCVIVGVLVAHLAVLIIWDNIRTSGKPPPKPPEPNFETSTTTFTSASGKTLKIEHEFTVETQFAPPDVMKKLPPPPAAVGANFLTPAAAH